jgi:DNA-binding NtrC family response regulator
LENAEFTLNRLIENHRKLQRLKHLEEQIVRQSSFEGLIGIGSEMQGVFSLIRRVFKSETTVLI